MKHVHNSNCVIFYSDALAGWADFRVGCWVDPHVVVGVRRFVGSPLRPLYWDKRDAQVHSARDSLSVFAPLSFSPGLHFGLWRSRFPPVLVRTGPQCPGLSLCLCATNCFFALANCFFALVRVAGWVQRTVFFILLLDLNKPFSSYSSSSSFSLLPDFPGSPMESQRGPPQGA